MTTARNPTFISLALIICFGAIGAVVIAPALPAMAAYFHVSAGQIEQLMTIYLFGYTMGQLLYAPIAHAFGRKPALFLGVSIAIVGTVLCILAEPLHSFSLLLFARLFMALGASVGLKMTFTIVTDVYEGKQAHRHTAFLVSAFAIMPGVATTIGGFLTQHFTWVSCFVFFAGYGLLLLPITWHLPETAKHFDRDAIKFSHILKNYLAVAKHKRLVLHALMVGVITAMTYIFAAVGPFIAIHDLGIRVDVYGMLNIIPYSGILLGSLILARLIGNVKAKKFMRASFVIMLSTILLMLVLFLCHLINMFTLLAPMFIIMASGCCIYSIAINLATSKVDDKTHGAAMMSFINMGFATLATLLVGLFHVEHAVGLAICFLLLSVFLGIMMRMARKKR